MNLVFLSIQNSTRLQMCEKRKAFVLSGSSFQVNKSNSVIVLPVILLGLFNVGYKMIKANSYPVCARGIIVN